MYVQNGKRPRTCSRKSVSYYQTSYDTCRGTDVWPLIGSKFDENSWKLDKVDKTRSTWPFQAKNRYDVTLANCRAPGVWFVLDFRMYLFLAPKCSGIPVFGKSFLKSLKVFFSRFLLITSGKGIFWRVSLKFQLFMETSRSHCHRYKLYQVRL